MEVTILIKYVMVVVIVVLVNLDKTVQEVGLVVKERDVMQDTKNILALKMDCMVEIITVLILVIKIITVAMAVHTMKLVIHGQTVNVCTFRINANNVGTNVTTKLEIVTTVVEMAHAADMVIMKMEVETPPHAIMEIRTMVIIVSMVVNTDVMQITMIGLDFDKKP